jgi:hypothetical protein
MFMVLSAEINVCTLVFNLSERAMKISTLFLCCAACLTLVTAAHSQIPSTISYQGFLESGGLPVDGQIPMVIRLFSQATGGSAVWSQSFPNVPVSKGVYTILLDVSTLVFDKQYWLETQINGSVSSTRTPMTSVPYSLGPWTQGIGLAESAAKESSKTMSVAATQNIYYVDGNVGIGTTNPAQLLTVGGGTLADTKIEVNAGGDTYAGLHVVNGAGAWNWQVVPSNDLPGGRLRLTDETANAEWLSISHAGFVGIGAPDAKCKLDVRSPLNGGGDMVHITGYDPFLTMYDANHGYRRGAIQQVNGGLNLFTDAYLTGTDPYGFVRLDNNGDLGIGASVPTAKLEVASLGGDICHLIGFEPFLTFYDANHGYRRSSIQAVDGGVNLFTDSYLQSGNSLACIRLSYDGNVGIGTLNPQVKLEVVGHTKTQVLEITGGGDFSESFDIRSSESGGTEIRPGMVVSIDPENPGKLSVSNTSYDDRVAGIISGAGGISPGMVMGQQGSIANGKYPVALTGRVYCWADASTGSIKPGDMLTSSAVPGHAMKAIDKRRTSGAIIGKAMTGLKHGKGLVLVLVTLR